jgi:hypothetical protein
LDREEAMGFAGLNLRLDAAERRTFLLLTTGHVLFVVALFNAAKLSEDYGLYAITPLFGLPLVLFGPRDRRIARSIVLLLGFALVHYAAVYCAAKSLRLPFTGAGLTNALWVAGGIGGLIGGMGSLALCALGRLLRPGRPAMLAIAIAVLCAIGAVGVTLMFQGWDAMAGEMAIARYLILYTPWQLAFAYFLAKLLRD